MRPHTRRVFQISATSKYPEGMNVASFDIGGIGFAARRPILDLGGLSDPAVAVMLEQGTIAEHLRRQRIAVVVLPEGGGRGFDFRLRLGLGDNPAVRLEAIFALETSSRASRRESGHGRPPPTAHEPADVRRTLEPARGADVPGARHLRPLPCNASRRLRPSDDLPQDFLHHFGHPRSETRRLAATSCFTPSDTIRSLTGLRYRPQSTPRAVLAQT